MDQPPKKPRSTLKRFYDAISAAVAPNDSEIIPDDDDDTATAPPTTSTSTARVSIPRLNSSSSSSFMSYNETTMNGGMDIAMDRHGNDPGNDEAISSSVAYTSTGAYEQTIGANRRQRRRLESGNISSGGSSIGSMGLSDLAFLPSTSTLDQPRAHHGTTSTNLPSNALPPLYGNSMSTLNRPPRNDQRLAQTGGAAFPADGSTFVQHSTEHQYQHQQPQQQQGRARGSGSYGYTAAEHGSNALSTRGIAAANSTVAAAAEATAPSTRGRSSRRPTDRLTTHRRRSFSLNNHLLVYPDSETRALSVASDFDFVRQNTPAMVPYPRSDPFVDPRAQAAAGNVVVATTGNRTSVLSSSSSSGLDNNTTAIGRLEQGTLRPFPAATATTAALNGGRAGRYGGHPERRPRLTMARRFDNRGGGHDEDERPPGEQFLAPPLSSSTDESPPVLGPHPPLSALGVIVSAPRARPVAASAVHISQPPPGAVQNIVHRIPPNRPLLMTTRDAPNELRMLKEEHGKRKPKIHFATDDDMGLGTDYDVFDKNKVMNPEGWGNLFADARPSCPVCRSPYDPGDKKCRSCEHVFDFTTGTGAPTDSAAAATTTAAAPATTASTNNSAVTAAPTAAITSAGFVFAAAATNAPSSSSSSATAGTGHQQQGSTGFSFGTSSSSAPAPSAATPFQFGSGSQQASTTTTAPPAPGGGGFTFTGTSTTAPASTGGFQFSAAASTAAPSTALVPASAPNNGSQVNGATSSSSTTQTGSGFIFGGTTTAGSTNSAAAPATSMTSTAGSGPSSGTLVVPTVQPAPSPATAVSTLAPTFQFGTAAASAPSADPTPPVGGGGFPSSAAATSSNAVVPFTFGSAPASALTQPARDEIAANASSTFGGSSSSSSSLFVFGQTPSAPAPAPPAATSLFGNTSASVETATQPTPAPAPTPAFQFGASASAPATSNIEQSQNSVSRNPFQPPSGGPGSANSTGATGMFRQGMPSSNSANASNQGTGMFSTATTAGPTFGFSAASSSTAPASVSAPSVPPQFGMPSQQQPLGSSFGGTFANAAPIALGGSSNPGSAGPSFGAFGNPAAAPAIPSAASFFGTNGGPVPPAAGPNASAAPLAPFSGPAAFGSGNAPLVPPPMFGQNASGFGVANGGTGSGGGFGVGGGHPGFGMASGTNSGPSAAPNGGGSGFQIGTFERAPQQKIAARQIRRAKR